MSQTIAGLMVELGINSAAFAEGCDKATYKAKQAAKEIGRAFQNMGSELSSIFAGIGGEVGGMFGEIVAGTGEAMRKISTQMGSISGPAGAAAVGVSALGAAVVATTAAVVILAARTAEANAKLFYTAQAAGVSFGELQRFDAAAKVVGVSSEGMALGLERMSRSAIKAAESSNFSSTSWGRLGITVRDSSGQLKTTSDLMAEVSDRFSSMADGPEKTARAIELFGRAGAGLIPFLNMGSEKMKELGDYAQRVGAILGDEAGRGAVRFAEAMEKVSLISEGVQNKLSVGVVDALDQVVGAYADASHGSDLFVKAGNAVGEMLRLLAIEISEDKAFIEQLADAFAKLNLTINLPFAMASEGPKKALAEFKKDWNDLTAQQHRAKTESDAFISSLNKKPDLFASLVKDFTPKKNGDTSAEGANAKIHPVTDIAGQMESKLASEIANTVALTGQRTALAGATTLANAEEKARNEIMAKQNQLTDELKAKQQELSDLKAPGSGATDKEISFAEQRIAQIMHLKATLEKETPEIIRLTQQLAVETQIKTADSNIDEFLAKSTLQRDVAVNQMQQPEQGPAEQLHAEVAKAVEKETLEVERATDAYNSFAAANGNLAASMAPVKAELDAATQRLQAASATEGQRIMATEITKVTAEFQKENDATLDQINSALTLADAYRTGGKALADAQIAQELEKDLTKIDDLKKALVSLGPVTVENADQMKAYSDAIDALTGKLDKQREALERRNAARESVAIADQTLKLTAQAAAFELVSRAALSSAAAQREASAQGAAKAFGMEHPEATPQEIKQVHDNTLQTENQKYNEIVLQTAAQADLNKRFQDQVQLLHDAQRLLQENARAVAQTAVANVVQQNPEATPAQLKSVYDSTLSQQRKADETTEVQIKGQLTEAEQRHQSALDQTAMKYGSLSQAFKGFADSLALEGQHLQGNFFATLKQGVDGLEDSFAKFIVTGKGGFIGVLKSMEEELIKLVLQLGIAKVEQMAFQALGLSSQAVGTGAAEIGRQAAIGEAAAEAATAAAWGGPEAAILAATITMVGLESITALAAGGDTQSGRTYLVGENGPELFAPGNGHVFNNSELNQMSARTPGASYLAAENRAATPGTGGAGDVRRGETNPTVNVAGGSQGHTVNVHTAVNTVDAAHFDELLDKHSRVVSRHVDNALRNSNQRLGQ